MGRSLAGEISALAQRLAAQEPHLALNLLWGWLNEGNDVVPRSVASLLARGPAFTHVALNMWGVRLAEEAHDMPFDDARPYFESAYAKFAKAIELKQDFPDSYGNWALALKRQSERAPLDVAMRLVADAEEKFAQVQSAGPERPANNIRWGHELAEHAKRLDGATRKQCLDRACMVLNRAVELVNALLTGLPSSSVPTARFAGPNSWRVDIGFDERRNLLGEKGIALHRLGTALAFRAESEFREVSDGFFNKAYEKFEQAHSVFKDSALLADWALALQKQAERKGSKAARELLERAVLKFEEALAHDPGAVHLKTRLGATLADLAEIESEPRRSEYFGRAEDAFSAAAESNPDDANTRLLRASALLMRAESASGELARDLFDRARNEIDRITAPASAGAALHFRGSIELAQAKKAGAGAEALAAASVESFRQSLRLAPDLPNALRGLGAALLEMSKLRYAERPALLREARERLSEAGNAGLLELARLEAAEQNHEAAIQALCRMRDSCELTAARYLRKVPEFAVLEQYPEYRSLLDSLEQDD